MIFPYGDMGCLTRRIIEEQYGITDYVLIDNTISKYNREVYAIEDLVKETGKQNSATCLLLVCKNYLIHEELMKDARSLVSENGIVDVFREEYDEWKRKTKRKWISPVPKTICGKYSYGPLCDDQYVERVGAFCSFAAGSCAVGNHALTYITTHPIAAQNTNNWKGFRPWEEDTEAKYHMDGIVPKGIAPRKRITIGNDVWIGRNTIITNYSNIGDGVIIGAGTVVTKPIPDYAVAVGNPARIIRFRYSPDQIRELKKIKWWDWDDDKIIEYYDDLLDDVDSFIRKHRVLSKR